MSLAQTEARADDDDHVGTEHVLLGILHEDGVAAATLRAAGITDDVFVAQLYDEPGSPPAGAIPLTPRAQMIIGLAAQEADERGHRLVEPEHLLVGVIRESDTWQSMGKTGPFHLLKAAEAADCDWSQLRRAAEKCVVGTHQNLSRCPTVREVALTLGAVHPLRRVAQRRVRNLLLGSS